MLNILVQTCESMEIGAVMHYIPTNRALQTWDPVENPDLELTGGLACHPGISSCCDFFPLTPNKGN